MTTEFEKDLQVADDLYDDGRHSGAVKVCSSALKFAKNDEQIAIALDRRGWSARYVGFKDRDGKNREAAYKMAREDWQRVLKISSDIDLRISAIKGLILLPEEDGEELYRTGITAVNQYADNLKAELGNSYGLMVREEDPEKAIHIFLNTYGTVEKETVIAGHLMQNVGTCYLILKGLEKNVFQRNLYAIEAINYLEIAIKEYPKDQIKHRGSTQGKIDRIKKEIGIEEEQ